MTKKNITYQVTIDFGNTLTNSTYGIKDGVLYTTTGGSYTYNSIIYNGDLLDRESIPDFQSYIDIQKSGNYTTYSNISVKLNIATGLLTYLRSNNVVIRGALVRLFISIDRGAMQHQWTGRVNDYPLDRKFITLNCVDEFNVIHSDQPSHVVEGTGEIIPKIIGNSVYSKATSLSKVESPNFDISTGLTSEIADNIFILGYTADRQYKQGDITDRRYFVPLGYNRLTLYVGHTNNLVENSLKDYYLTFINQLDDSLYCGRVLSSDIAYTFGYTRDATGAYAIAYAVDVILDKAVPFEKEQLSDTEVDPFWYEGGVQPSNYVDFAYNLGFETAKFSQFDTRILGAQLLQGTGKKIAWGSRQWANVDTYYRVGTSSVDYQLNKCKFPLNLPAEYPVKGGTPNSLGYVRWVPIEKISSAAFTPYKWADDKDGVAAGTTTWGRVMPNALDEPIFFKSPTDLQFGMEAPLVSLSTMATLRSKDYIHNLILADNAETRVDYEFVLRTEDDENILHHFELDDGVVSAKTPEWTIKTQSSDLTYPIENKYPHYSSFKTSNVWGGYNLAYNTSLTIGTANRPTAVYYNNFYNNNESKCKGLYFDTNEDTLSWKSNNSDEFLGADTVMNLQSGYPLPALNYAVGVVPDAALRQSTYTYYLSYCDHTYRTTFEHDPDSNFQMVADLYIREAQANPFLGAVNNSSINVFINIKAFRGDPLPGILKPYYESGQTAIGSFSIGSAYLRDIIDGTGHFALQIGDIPADFTHASYDPQCLLACVFPEALKASYEDAQYIQIEVTASIEHSHDYRIGLRPSYMFMSKNVESDTLIGDISSNSDGLHYPDGVNEVFTNFDDASQYISYTDGSLEVDYTLGGYPTIGRQYNKSTSTLSLARDLAQRGFFGISALSNGKRAMTPWLYRKNPVKNFATIVGFGDKSIKEGTLNSIKTSPFSMVYTHVALKYNENNKGELTEYLNINRTEEDAFPSVESDWSSYVNASENITYQNAKSLWESFHNAYLRRKGKQVLDSSLATAPELLKNSNNSGANVIAYLTNIINWCTFTKDMTSFSVNIEDGFDVSLLQCVSVRDPILTSDLAYIGWVYDKRLDTKLNEIELSVIFDRSPFDPLDEITDIDELVMSSYSIAPIDDIDESNETDMIINEETE